VGETVVTGHLVRDGGQLRQILLVHGNLDRPSDRVIVGAPLEADEVLGYVGDTARPGRPALYLEARQLREGQSLGALSGPKLRSEVTSIATDVRNLLSLQGANL
jgi:hypothetical protein